MSTPSAQRWIHPTCQLLPLSTNGPFLAMPDGRLLTVDEHGAHLSADDGAIWTALTPAPMGQISGTPSGTRLVQTASGAIVMLFLHLKEYCFSWDDAAGEPKPDCRLELWAARSVDGGQSWVDRQRLLDGYNANFMGFIQMRTGRLVASIPCLVTRPGHWVACSLYSDDDGRSWQKSHNIDLGGHGHHDGALEPTLGELSDGRLLMLIRTNWDRFWQAVSDDGGRSWRTIMPTPLDASSAPGQLLRLRSGRLAFVWNRLNPEGRVWPKEGPSQLTELPASWHREELSIAFSSDDALTWTSPLVIARQHGGQLSYPYLFERHPGELWVIAEIAFKKGWEDPEPLRLLAREDELVQAAKIYRADSSALF